uniref:Uncharacterized protein n=1 Tax=Lactuca sativa TaxID=4236 RepID=A0A9R1XK50_LACSA|nr:hypothetical protein LSAT_V11C300123960 [Lactuca sativa]
MDMLLFYICNFGFVVFCICNVGIKFVRLLELSMDMGVRGQDEGALPRVVCNSGLRGQSLIQYHVVVNESHYVAMVVVSRVLNGRCDVATYGHDVATI